MVDKSLKHKNVTPTKASTVTRKRRRKKKKVAGHDSIVKACLPFEDLLGGPTVHLSFDCPKNLRTAFNRATESVGQATCFVLRGFMQAYIVAQHYRQACFPKALEPVNIENLIMPTYVKERVRRVKVVDKVEYIDEDEVLEKPVSGSPEKCAVCSRPSYAKVVLKDDSEMWLCRRHFLDKKRNFKGVHYVKDVR